MKRIQGLLLVLTLFGFSSLTRAADAPKNKYGPEATPLHLSHDYFSHHVAPDFWALSPYYVSQQDEGACILASFAMTLNALRADEKLTAADELILQPKLLKAISADGGPAKRFYIDHGKSVTLDEMAPLFQKAAKLLIHKNVQVDVLHADAADPKFGAKLEKLLIENEKSAHNFIIANFLQSEFTGDPEGAVGHASPIAAYDAKTKRVLILDPDRQYYEPYWVTLSAFIKGLNTLDKDAGKNRGVIFIHE
jgi:hypothetical protein